MRTLSKYCFGKTCPSVKQGRPTLHQIVGIQPGEETRFGKMADQYRVRCQECQSEALESIPKRRCHKRTWPYYNESAGVTFESDSHEQKYVKDNNLTPA